MKEKPILFAGEMVRAILADRKTVTRRVVRIPGLEPGATHLYPVPKHAQETRSGWEFSFDGGFDRDVRGPVRCPFGEPGTRLWVREACSLLDAGADGTCVAYRASCDDNEFDYVSPRGDAMRIHVPKWRPSIHMPRWASRISLLVTAARVERLTDITEEDARAEGVDGSAPLPGLINGEPGTIHCFGPDASRKAFALLWDAINPKAPFDSSPWVWRIEFRRVAADAARGAA